MYSRKVIDASRAALERRLGFSLIEYSPTAVQDFAYRMRDVDWENGERDAIIRSLPSDIQAYIVNDLQMSKIDFEYWCSRYALIVDDKGRNVPLVPWPSQRALLDVLAREEEKAWDYYVGSSERELMAKIALILLKSRQIGGTVISEALLAHLVTLFSHTRSVIASDHPDNTLKLFRVLTNMIDSLPPWMKPIQDARVKANNLHFSELDSDVVAGAGNQKTTLGQGMTIDAAHLTELSTWDPGNADAIDADLKPAFNSSRKHHSLMVLESTGQGGKGNWYHDQFQAARNGTSRFVPLFVGWFMCPNKWAMPTQGITLRDETIRTLARIEAETGIACTKEQGAWYQTERDDYEGKGKLGLFLQEYPSSIEEAFQLGLDSAFSIETRWHVREKCQLPVAVFDFEGPAQRFRKIDLEKWQRSDEIDKWDGKFIIWERPRAGNTYIVGVDASYGLDGGDNSSIQVLRVGNKMEPDEQVAEWTGRIPPADLSVPAWLIGHMYTDKWTGLPALMAIECNPGSPGIVCQTDLLRRGYKNFYVYKRPLKSDGGGWKTEVGWQTTSITRTIITEEGVEGIKKRDLIVNSPWVVDEMGSFVKKMDGAGRRKLEHADGYHDDRLMALFIAFYIAHENDQRSMADARRKALEQRFAPEEKIVQFQTLGVSWEEANAMWEKNLESLYE